MTVSPQRSVDDVFSAFSPERLSKLRADAEQFITDDGISYGQRTDDADDHPWRYDPLPMVISSAEWTELERGLEQRARMLAALLDDLAGPKTLIHSGALPASLVLRHEGFIASVSDLGGPLSLVALDVIQSEGGSWVSFNDMAQSPSGAGYAMANRRLSARLLDETYRKFDVRRLRGFFDHLYGALQSAAPAGSIYPQVALLTAGAGAETAYDQALLASILGTPLAHGVDLMIEEGRVWMNTTQGQQPVDVIHRRIDAAWADSLDLRRESRLGVAGLAAAVRRGSVAVANPLNSGLIENPGLAAFESNLFKTLLGEEQILATPTTFWCGDDKHREHVLANLDKLVIKPVSRGLGPATYRGWELTDARKAYFTEQIQTEPWAWSAREAVVAAKRSSLTGNGLTERRVILRAFGAASGDSFVFMPGGLARVGRTSDQIDIRSATGALSKDVWVLGDGGDHSIDVGGSARPATQRFRNPGLSSRAAENMFWFGRYTERAESGARIAGITDGLVRDHASLPGTPGHSAMSTMMSAMSEVTGLPSPQDDDDFAEFLSSLVFDEKRPGTVAFALKHAELCALEDRELLSAETFSVMSRLETEFMKAKESGSGADRADACLHILEAGLALAGLAHESTVRDPIWAFQESGRRIERAHETLRLLSATLGESRSPVTEGLLVESVLRCADSLITYQRRMAFGSSDTQPVVALLELLLLDPTNPRSVMAQLVRLREALGFAPKIAEKVARLEERCGQVDIYALAGDRNAMCDFLTTLATDVGDISNRIERDFFYTEPQQQNFAADSWEVQ